MSGRPLISGFLGLLLALTAYGQSAVSGSAGYELYSWKIKGHWYYSLLQRRGSKTYQEITANPSLRRDSSGLEAELRKLPKGTEVFWMSDAPSSANRPSTPSNLDIKHPSRQRIKHIRSICNRLGLRLSLR
ncbi:MAG TPA: hypothetical protein VLM38_00885 [Blastocatellia bacterium]|nr:hypothetical protein [Blastocatellia bacterium]